jgi:hypothetical protein
MVDNRGQIFALEGVLAALVVLAGIAFALQATVLTPTTSGGTEAPVEGATLDSVLTTAVETGSLRDALVDDWDGSGFTSGGDGWYTSAYPSNDFGAALRQSLDETVTANVVVSHRTPSNGREQTRLVYNGAPGDGAVRASTVVTLYDRDVCSGTCTATARNQFFAADLDTSSSGQIYNVLEVEVVAWQG